MGAAASRVRAARGGGAPRLGLVTVGQLAEGHTGDDAGAREQLAPYGQSWFNKKAAGERHGVEVEQVDLPHETSTALTLTLILTLTLTLTPNPNPDPLQAAIGRRRKCSAGLRSNKMA